MPALGVVAVVWKAARLLGRESVPAALVVGLNQLTLVHSGAAHNDVLVVLLTRLGVLAFVNGGEREGVMVATLTARIKASGAIVVPFLCAGAPRKGAGASGGRRHGSRDRLVGADRLRRRRAPEFGDARLQPGSSTTAHSFPNKAAAAAGRLLPGDFYDYEPVALTAFGLAFAGAAAWLLLRTWRGADPISMAGWATLVALICIGWLVPW